MIKYTSGDIFREQTEAIVNTVNCVGVMGRGIALQFKKAYPENFKLYEQACKDGLVQPGQMLVVRISHLTNPQYIINFPTKRHWKGKSRMEDIDFGLKSLVEEVQKLGLKSISLPPLGCGLGGLDWAKVKPLIALHCESLPSVDFHVFEPNGAPQPDTASKVSKTPNMTAGRAALIGLMNKYLTGLMDTSVSLLEVHKLMYFMQTSGQPLRLEFAKHLYGPYAVNLGHVLDHIEGHYTSGYADGGDSPSKQIKLLPGAVEDAKKFLESDPKTITRFNRVAALVDGFESAFGLELLGTVHWVATKEGAKDKADVVAKVFEWNEGKKKFSPRQVELAYDILQTKDWLT
jgi:O-acetyl-ADP-ribose deacetylase (regulator of RNase III)